MKILLVCWGGFSTSLLVQKMKEAINLSQKLKSHDIKIIATSKEEFLDESRDASIVLLGPQVSHIFEDVVKELKENNIKIPVQVMDANDYGNMNAVPILKSAFDEIKNYRSNI